jgi:hopanoid biosynthesis associated protein HpnK
VTADDFGLAPEVNEAVELAHRHGILTCASLMVAAPAAHDAVRRARALPDLKVGLHLVLAEGRPVLPPGTVPDLVDRAGRFRTDLFWLGVHVFIRRKVRHQVAAEIEAQFERYAATGLALDHVNSHKHFHLHPTVSELVYRIGTRFGMRAVRAPVEPARVLSRIDRSGIATPLLTNPLAMLMRARLRRRSLLTADHVFGLAWSGAMTERRIEELLTCLPVAATSEIYCHPATSGGFKGATNHYRYAEEYAALRAPVVRQTTTQLGIQLIGYSDLSCRPAGPMLGASGPRTPPADHCA